MYKNSIILVICVVLLITGLAQATPHIDLEAIATIESNGNSHAVGDAGEVGLFQIMGVVRESYNQRTGHNFSREDLFVSCINRQIASWYLYQRIPEMLKYFGKTVTVEHILWAYNAGIGNLVKEIKPKTTINYIKKYKNIVESKNHT